MGADHLVDEGELIICDMQEMADALGVNIDTVGPLDGFRLCLAEVRRLKAPVSDVRSINELRAEKEKDGTLWTAEEAIRALLRDLESGAWHPFDFVFIAGARRGEAGQLVSTPFVQGGPCTSLEVRGLLTQHLYEICHQFTERTKA